MTETHKRIVFGLLMAGIALLSVWIGREASLLLLAVIGILAVDEIFCNIFKERRFSLYYFTSEGIFILPFFYFNFFNSAPAYYSMFYNAGIVLNLFLISYLIYVDIKGPFLTNFKKAFPYSGGLLIVIPLMSLGYIFTFSSWEKALILFLSINFMMDVGAWFFGKNFGKHKLSPKVSPNKTIEGLVGGVLSSGLVGILMSYLLFSKISVKLFFLFTLIAFISQLGDLIQSKIKRQAGIKDSSSLIPGHGGVYDRVDSMLFSAPFYASILKFIYF